MFSEANNNNTASQPRNDTTDENAHSEAFHEASQPRQAAAPATATAAAVAKQPRQGDTEQLRTEQTPERTGNTGDAETDEVQFFTETTQELHTQTESDAHRLPRANGAGAQTAAPARLNPTAPTPTSAGTPSVRVDGEGDNASEAAAQQPVQVVSHPAEEAAESIAPPVPRTRGPGHTPRGARPNSTRPPQRPPSRTSSRYGTPRLSRGDAQPCSAAAAQALIPETQVSRVPQAVPLSVTRSDHSANFQVEDDPSYAEKGAAGAQVSHLPQIIRPSVAQSDRSINFQIEDEVSGGAKNAAEAQASHSSQMIRPSVAQSDRSINFQVEDEPPGAVKDAADAQKRASHLPQTIRPSVAQSDRSINFQVENEVSDANSVSSKVEPTAANQPKLEHSVEPETLTETSDIHFSVVPESQAAGAGAGGAAARSGLTSAERGANTETSEIHFEVEPTQSSHVQATTNSTTSVQFDIASTANNTRHSSVSHFTVENDEPQPVPVKQTSQVNGNAAAVPEEVVRESEAGRRAQKAEQEHPKKALAERSKYTNTRSWAANTPHPRARRTNSQAAAHARKKQEAEKDDSAAQRHKDMHARPWRAGMSTTPKKQAPVEKKPRNAYDRPWRAHMSTSPRKVVPVEKVVNDRPWRAGMATTPKKKRAVSPESSDEEVGNTTWRQARNSRAAVPPVRAASPSTSSSSPASLSSAESSVRRAPARDIDIPLLPVKPFFDAAEAAKFVTPAPVLKAPLQVLGEEVEGWCETVSQQRNLQAILEVMRARERNCARLSSQQQLQEVMTRHLNKELYAIRDAYVRKRDTDVTGMPLHARREAVQENGVDGGGGDAAAAGAAKAEKEPDYMLLRLYPRQTHQATDYVALMQQRSGVAAVSVLSDEDMSDSEKADFAEELAQWRAERQSLRKEKARLARERRDLTFQMRRGSNIKDIKLTQPTSGRGPLERRASGTETKVDIDGYDKLMDLRIAAQKADVEAANAKDAYDSVNTMATMMRKQYNANSRELTDMQEVQEEAKERYEKILQEIRHRIEESRPVIDRAQATLQRREREALRSNEENAQAELREYSDAILAMRLQVDRAAAMVDAAGGDEERMRRASTPRVGGMSRTATPRGSISGSRRPDASPRGRANSQSKNDDVFARLTGRKSVDATNGASADAPKETSVQA